MRPSCGNPLHATPEHSQQRNAAPRPIADADSNFELPKRKTEVARSMKNLFPTNW
jgi:hypothetical protein